MNIILKSEANNFEAHYANSDLKGVQVPHFVLFSRQQLQALLNRLPAGANAVVAYPVRNTATDNVALCLTGASVDAQGNVTDIDVNLETGTDLQVVKGLPCPPHCPGGNGSSHKSSHQFSS